MAKKTAKKQPVDDDIALTKEQQLMLSTRSLIHRLKNPQDGLPVSHETAAILDVIQSATEAIIRNVLLTSIQQTQDLEAIIHPESKKTATPKPTAKNKK